ncbi:MAG: hypothetical protein AAB426_14375, partial [Myxococcota bacterium]
MRLRTSTKRVPAGWTLVAILACAACGNESVGPEPWTRTQVAVRRQFIIGQWDDAGARSVRGSGYLGRVTRTWEEDPAITYETWPTSSLSIDACSAAVIETPTCDPSCPSGYRCYFTPTHVATCLRDYTDVETTEPAGVVTVTGGLTPVTLAADSTGHYPAIDIPDAALFAGGETLVLAAQGDSTPAFGANILAPALITDVAPTVTAPFVLPTSGALTFSWTPGAGLVEVYLGMERPNFSASARCAADASSGSLAVPASVL